MTTRRKLIILKQVIETKLLYGAETWNLSAPQAARLNTVVFKGLRMIFRVPTTFVNRLYSNRWLINKATKTWKTKKLSQQSQAEPDDQPFSMPSQTLVIRKAKLLNKLIQGDSSQPETQAVFWLPKRDRVYKVNKQTLSINTPQHETRRNRKQPWIKNTLKQTWDMDLKKHIQNTVGPFRKRTL